MQINKISDFFRKLIKKHKHHELIEAKKRFTELKIQFELNGLWIDVENPSWSSDINYRFKTEKMLTFRFRRYLNKYGEEILVAIDASKRDDFVRWAGDWEELNVQLCHE